MLPSCGMARLTGSFQPQRPRVQVQSTRREVNQVTASFVVPLQFVSAATLTKLLENFAAKPGMIRA